ncbi:MAG: L-rhamnose mutarotase [Verrucomicrobia bacterium]|nr:L-rhamnose mutarotase [Verrucomicrobiota bacterium]
MRSRTHQSTGDGVKRMGMVIKLKPECVAKYRELHADGNPGVRDLLAKYHLENFSIFLRRIGEEWFEFGYCEYRGADFESDMAALAAEPRNQAWLEVCDPMQLPLDGENGWAVMEQVYYNSGATPP